MTSVHASGVTAGYADDRRPGAAGGSKRTSHQLPAILRMPPPASGPVNSPGTTRVALRPEQLLRQGRVRELLSTLKLHPMDRRWWATSGRARRGIFEYIEAFYDRAGCTPCPAASARWCTRPAGSPTERPLTRHSQLLREPDPTRPAVQHPDRRGMSHPAVREQHLEDVGSLQGAEAADLLGVLHVETAGEHREAVEEQPAPSTCAG